MMRLSSPLLAIVSLFLYTFQATAIYADEAYTTDYHHALLGVPQAHTTFFHRPSVGSKASLLYTLSEKLVLGAVNPKDGSVVWRQRLGAGNHSTGSLLQAGEDGTIVSAIGGNVQLWNAADGRLAWDWQGAGTVKGLQILESDGKRSVVAFSDEGSKAVLRRFAADSGEVIWEHEDVRLVRTIL